MENMLDTEFNPGAIAAQIGAHSEDGLWHRVRRAAYLESDTPYERPFTGRRYSNDEIYQSGCRQHELRHGKKTIEGIVHYVRMRHDSAHAQLKQLRRTIPRTVDGFPQAAETWNLPRRGHQEPRRLLGHVHALFQQRVDGDDALLRLAGLRFAQMGMAAEVYARLAGPARECPAVRALPCAPACRPPEPGINVLHGRDRAVVREFADRFAGRVAGLVVHDKREMAGKTDGLLAAMRELNAHLCQRPGGPLVFLEPNIRYLQVVMMTGADSRCNGGAGAAYRRSNPSGRAISICAERSAQRKVENP